MTQDEIKKVLEVLFECHPTPEDFNWGPTLEFAKKRHSEAIKILKRELVKTTHETETKRDPDPNAFFQVPKGTKVKISFPNL